MRGTCTSSCKTSVCVCVCVMSRRGPACLLPGTWQCWFTQAMVCLQMHLETKARSFFGLQKMSFITRQITAVGACACSFVGTSFDGFGKGFLQRGVLGGNFSSHVMP